MSEEKRDGARVAMISGLEGEVMVFQPMAIREVSLRGALVETRFPLHLNSLHDLRLELAERSVVVKGRVVHSQVADVDDDALVYWSGIEFVEPSEHVSLAIAEFLSSVR
jgi:hypothetical protein